MNASSSTDHVKIIVLDPDRTFAKSVATQSRVITLDLVSVERLGDKIEAFEPDLVLIHQQLAQHAVLNTIRTRGQAHVQSIILLTNAGPPPPGMSGLADGFIWREVSADSLALYIRQAVRRKTSLARLRAVRRIT